MNLVYTMKCKYGGLTRLTETNFEVAGFLISYFSIIMGRLAQKQHTVTGHRALKEWRHIVDKLNNVQNADAKRMQAASGNAVGTQQIKSTSERINQCKSPYAGEHQLKVTKGVVHSNHQMAANLDRSEEVDFAVKAEIMNRFKDQKSQSDNAILVEISMPPEINFKIEVA